MHEAVICEPIRTAVGKYGGIFRDVPAVGLATTVIKALMDRTGIPPDTVDDVILGQCYPNGEAPAIGRVAALDAGLPTHVPGMQLDRRCGSGLQAVLDATMRVQLGLNNVVIAGGVESMSQAEHYMLGARFGIRGEATMHDRIERGRVMAGGVRHPVPGGMVETAENLRAQYGISREDQDRLALASHQRALAAQRDGLFADEIVPVESLDRRGSPLSLYLDEHPRPDVSLEKLTALRAVRESVDIESTVTAGNASGQNDGASVCVVTSATTAERLGLRPLARLVSWGLAAVEPSRMGIGPVPATELALERAGLELGEIDIIEINEAFAAQVLAVVAELQIEPDDERLNPLGSGISLGHPVGATGCRILTTMVRELARRKGRYALETMCIGGGQGLAAVFERIP